MRLSPRHRKPVIPRHQHEGPAAKSKAHLAIADDVAHSLREVSAVKLTVFVASAPGYDEQAKVANGASELLNEVLGERGRQPRSAVGVAALPRRSPVEVEAILTISDET